MSADERIPVTEETRKELHDLKEPGETYDDLLRSLVQNHRRKEIAERLREMDELRDDYIPLDEV
jgi:predicted CopG family antitoxin